MCTALEYTSRFLFLFVEFNFSLELKHYFVKAKIIPKTKYLGTDMECRFSSTIHMGITS
jgi:hypothetical protein